MLSMLAADGGPSAGVASATGTPAQGAGREARPPRGSAFADILAESLSGRPDGQGPRAVAEEAGKAIVSATREDAGDIVPEDPVSTDTGDAGPVALAPETESGEIAVGEGAISGTRQQGASASGDRDGPDDPDASVAAPLALATDPRPPAASAPDMRKTTAAPTPPGDAQAAILAPQSWLTSSGPASVSSGALALDPMDRMLAAMTARAAGISSADGTLPAAAMSSTVSQAPIASAARDPDAPVRLAPELATPAEKEARPAPHTAAGTAPAQIFTTGAPVSASAPLPGAWAPASSLAGQLAAQDPERISEQVFSASDLRTPGQAAPAATQQAAQIMSAGHLAERAASQIAVAVERAAGQKTIDLSLNPEELGRVRLRLSMSEGGLSVLVLAERGETLDLLRRNIEMLARDFLEIGYESARFDFARNGRGSDDPAPGSAPYTPQPAGMAPVAETAPARLLLIGDRLDIRL